VQHWAKPLIRVEQELSCGGHPLNAVLSSIVAFLAAGVRPPTPFAKAIRLVLVIKLVAIAAIGVVMVASAGGPAVDAGAVARLIGPLGSPDEAGR
jgi:hypothetical protein